jgi:hypothetical protein
LALKTGIQGDACAKDFDTEVMFLERMPASSDLNGGIARPPIDERTFFMSGLRSHPYLSTVSGRFGRHVVQAARQHAVSAP